MSIASMTSVDTALERPFVRRGLHLAVVVFKRPLALTCQRSVVFKANRARTLVSHEGEKVFVGQTGGSGPQAHTDGRVGQGFRLTAILPEGSQVSNKTASGEGVVRRLGHVVIASDRLRRHRAIAKGVGGMAILIVARLA